MNARVDLQQLAGERIQAPPPRGGRRHVWTRYVLPLAIILAFAAIMAWSARESLLPARPVTVLPVIVAKGQAQQGGAPLFQAAGWVEPRPTAVMVSALVEGVVEDLLVAEGEAVERGQPLARLVDRDARLAVADAQAVLDLRQAELSQAEGALAAAKTNLEQPIHLEAALAEAEAALARLQTEAANLPFAIRAAKARLQLAEQDLEGKRSVSESISGRLIQKAQSEFDSTTAAYEELGQRVPSLKKEIAAWERRCAALEQQLRLKVEETRKHSESQANVAAASAKLTQAKVALESAELRLARMTVTSPLSGRVLALNAQPGRRLMGINAASERDASMILSLYDPKQLQVRADVRLEDVHNVQPGQSVSITSAALSEPLLGHVTRITSTADNQKNTLQVKVAIDEPPAHIKPEMLVQATFLALAASGDAADEPSSLRLLVPKQLVEKSSGGDFVWIVDTNRGVARRKAVETGRAGAAELAEVTQGLSAMDKLIVSGREGLTDGQRIKITGDDATLGIGQP